jgi:hypothetical protein
MNREDSYQGEVTAIAKAAGKKEDIWLADVKAASLALVAMMEKQLNASVAAIVLGYSDFAGISLVRTSRDRLGESALAPDRLPSP